MEPMTEARLAVIRKGAEEAKRWPAPAGSRWVAERADDLLALCDEVERLRADREPSLMERFDHVNDLLRRRAAYEEGR